MLGEVLCYPCSNAHNVSLNGLPSEIETLNRGLCPPFYVADNVMAAAALNLSYFYEFSLFVKPPRQ